MRRRLLPLLIYGLLAVFATLTLTPCEFYLDLLHRAANSTWFYCTTPASGADALEAKGPVRASG